MDTKDAKRKKMTPRTKSTVKAKATKPMESMEHKWKPSPSSFAIKMDMMFDEKNGALFDAEVLAIRLTRLGKMDRIKAEPMLEVLRGLFKTWGI